MIIYKGQVIDSPAVYDDEGNEITPATYKTGVYVLAHYSVPELAGNLVADEPNAGAFAGIRTRYYRFDAEQDWLDWVAANSDEDGVLQVTPRPPAPPRSVTARQANEALIITGLIDQVQPAIDAVEDPLERALAHNFYQKSNDFERNNSVLISIAKNGLGMTDDEIDDLFRLAATR